MNSETLAYPNNQQNNRLYCHYGRLFGENVTFIVVLLIIHCKQAGNNAFSGWNNMRHFLFKGKKMSFLQSSVY